MTKIVTLDAGHGGKDPGAGGHGLAEKDLTLEIVRKAKTHLMRNYRVNVHLTRDRDAYVGLGQRTGAANTRQADCLVSVHINSFSDQSANGLESFVYTTDGPGTKSVALQKILHRKLANIWTGKGRRDRGMKKANFHMVREFHGAAVLLELGFISNPTDADLLRDDGFLNANAVELAEGIAAYLELPRQDQPDPERIYRVIVEGTQVGAYAEPENVAQRAEKAVRAGKRHIEIKLIE